MPSGGDASAYLKSHDENSPGRFRSLNPRVDCHGHHLENPKFHFVSGGEARRKLLLGKDLAIPELLLPESATDIVLQYDMDTGERWLTHSFVGDRAVRLPECTADPALDIDDVRAPWWWSRAAARLDTNSGKYRCVDRGELPGFRVEYDCVLILGRSEGAWSCDSGRQIAK